MKLLHSLVSILFVVFAVVQWNDPDPYLWVVLYLVIAVIPIMYLKGKLNRMVLGVLTLGLFVLFGTYVPDLLSWLYEGMPSITTSMKAGTPYIEVVRESLGLLLCFFVSAFYLLRIK